MQWHTHEKPATTLSIRQAAYKVKPQPIKTSQLASLLPKRIVAEYK